MIKNSLRFVIWFCLVFHVTFSEAQHPKQKADFESLESQYELVQKSINTSTADLKKLQELENKLTVLRPKLTVLIEEYEALADKANKQLRSLGAVTANESNDLQVARKSLSQEHADYSQFAAKLKLLILKGDDQLQFINTEQTRILRQRLLNREPDIIDLFIVSWKSDQSAFRVLIKTGFQKSGVEQLSIVSISVFVFLLTLGLFLSLTFKHKTLVWAKSKAWDDDITSRFVQNVTITTVRYLPRFVFVLTLSVFSLIEYQNVASSPLFAVVCYGLSFLVLLFYLNVLFFKPKSPARLFLEISAINAKAVAKRMRLLFLVGFIGYLFHSILQTNAIPDHFVLLARDVFAILLIFILIWMVSYAKHIPQLVNTIWLQRSIVLYLFVILLMELSGYRNLALFLFRILAISMFAYGVFLLFHQILSEFFDALDQGKRAWHKPIRAALGLRSGQHIPGLIGMRLISGMVLWAGFIFVLLQVFGLSDEVVIKIRAYVIDGFTIGDLRINPTRIFMAGVAFTLLFTLSNWIKVKLDTKWLVGFKVERGARETLITVTGYVGVIVSILIALSIAGVTFTNFAIIAGALSVGIGFGLQNIVNNFVSGLILLFERPIRKGDWIVVGATEGYVKRISIRSTQLQTFDRADVIIPNSDLISNQVTNWMLHDKSGRIRIPVGVAYGSDTEKVRQVLLSVADTHEAIIKNDEDFKVQVFFMAFGDSSLNMELRCHIKKIDEKFKIISDLNFAIDKAFRENNIEIPFPQRDIHFKNALSTQPPE